jgi:transcriptional regulator with XRE-family HTH domain
MPALSETAIAHSDEALAHADVHPSDAGAGEMDAFERRVNFCAYLRAARERRGIPLQAISDATKVSESLYADLERCDVARWPFGIYRRAFIREYAAFIGLPVEATVSEFLALFPEEIDRESGKAALAPGPLRLTLARGVWARVSPVQVQAALLDTILIAAGAGALVWAVPLDPWAALAGVALGYHVIATVLIGRSLGTWLVRSGGPRKRSRLVQFVNHFWDDGL